MSEATIALRKIALFLALTAAVSSVFYSLIIVTGHVGSGNGTYELGLMWSPALGAILACRFTRSPLRELGWSWGAWRWQWLAFVIPLIYTTLAYGFVWSAGLGGFPDAKFLSATRESLGWTGASNDLVLGGYFVLIASAGMIMSIAFALGEEIGWRGLLAPQLTKAFGFKTGALLTGLIWYLWHLPILFFADYNSASPRWFAAGCLAVLLVGMSVIMAWLRMRSGSLWTAALFHASHNQFIQVFFTPATSSRGPVTAYAIDEFGFALPAVVLVFAALFWRLARRYRGLHSATE